jgi:hypothetical protein
MLLAILYVGHASGTTIPAGHAAEITGNMQSGVVLVGSIKTGDYDKLRNVYGDMRN